jgi:hypothetical protein
MRNYSFLYIIFKNTRFIYTSSVVFIWLVLIYFQNFVPVNGSEPSFHAAEVASTLANRFNSKIILLYNIVISRSRYE